MATDNAQVGIIIGSDSDRTIMEAALHNAGRALDRERDGRAFSTPQPGRGSRLVEYCALT